MSEIYAPRRRGYETRAIALPSPFTLSGWANQQAYKIHVQLIQSVLYMKACVRSVDHLTGAYPGFCSMKRFGIFLLPPGWDASPSHGYPEEPQEQNAKPGKFSRIQTACLGVQRANHYSVPTTTDMIPIRKFYLLNIITSYTSLASFPPFPSWQSTDRPYLLYVSCAVRLERQRPPS